MKIGIVYFTYKSKTAPTSDGCLFDIDSVILPETVPPKSALFYSAFPFGSNPAPCVFVVPDFDGPGGDLRSHWPMIELRKFQRKFVTVRDTSIYEKASLELASWYWSKYLTYPDKDVSVRLNTLAVTNPKGFARVFGKRDHRTAKNSYRDLAVITFWESAAKQGFTNKSFAVALKNTHRIAITESDIAKIRERYDLPTLMSVKHREQLAGLNKSRQENL